MKMERFEELKSLAGSSKARADYLKRLTQWQGLKNDRALSWQMQSAGVSAMGNIAEAHGRYSFEDKRRFLDISLGSCKEVQSHLYVAVDQGFIENNLQLQIERRPSTRTRLRRDGQ